ncbi:MAG TPA: HlyC/CorC family transporter [Alphaproteobacteria bacterium]|jgi:Mg2+/Co2+ transporter CorB|nr:HlyC/CorC family transporter [Alphaproteobacteria bacterium]
METALLISLAAIAVLLLLSGFFSGSETALTAASRVRITELERQGDRRASIVARLIEARERLIGAILLGNNLVNIMASALATSLLIGWFGDAGVAYATVIMTALVLVFAEVLPKTYALRHPERTALRVAPVVRVLVVVLAPVVQTIQAIVRLTLRLFGAEKGVQAHLLSPAEEIRSAIRLHADEGGIVKRESDMLRGIFDLSDVDVSEIMVHRKNMMMVDADEPAEKVVAEVLANPYTRVPMWRDEPENIVGVIHAKDLLRGLSDAGGDIAALDLDAIAVPPWFVPETTLLLEQLSAFRARHAHFALVVDEYGSLMGLVTLEDILEEIVGPISDEYDVAVQGVRQTADGHYLVEGDVTIRDLNRDLGWNLPDEEASTVAGLVIHEAQIIPNAGQVFQYYGHRFEILRRQPNQITLLRLSGPEPADDESDAGAS